MLAKGRRPGRDRFRRGRHDDPVRRVSAPSSPTPRSPRSRGTCRRTIGSTKTECTAEAPSQKTPRRNRSGTCAGRLWRISSPWTKQQPPATRRRNRSCRRSRHRPSAAIGSADVSLRAFSATNAPYAPVCGRRGTDGGGGHNGGRRSRHMVKMAIESPGSGRSPPRHLFATAVADVGVSSSPAPFCDECRRQCRSCT